MIGVFLSHSVHRFRSTATATASERDASCLEPPYLSSVARRAVLTFGRRASTFRVRASAGVRNNSGGRYDAGGVSDLHAQTSWCPRCPPRSIARRPTCPTCPTSVAFACRRWSSDATLSRRADRHRCTSAPSVRGTPARGTSLTWAAHFPLTMSQAQVIGSAEPLFGLVPSTSGPDRIHRTISRAAPSVKSTLRKLQLLPHWLSCVDFRPAFTSGVSANMVCFKRQLLDQSRLVSKTAISEAATPTRRSTLQ